MKIEWWWVLRIEPVFHRGVAVFCALVSICILWSELVFNVKSPVISLIAVGLRACGLNYAAVEVNIRNEKYILYSYKDMNLTIQYFYSLWHSLH